MASLANASPLPPLFKIEALLKIIGGAIFIFSPSTILRNLSFPLYSPTSLSLVRALGTQTIAFSIPLFLAARGDADSVRSRRLVYWALVGREGLLGELWVQRGRGTVSRDEVEEEEKALEEGLVSETRARREEMMVAARKLRKGLWLWVAELMPFVLGRLWVLRYREEWFE